MLSIVSLGARQQGKLGSQEDRRSKYKRMQGSALYSCLAHSGSEIHLRRPIQYRLPGDRDISFAQISELCRLRDEIAIGYISEAGEVRIAPKGHSIKTYTDSDRILTIGHS